MKTLPQMMKAARQKQTLSLRALAALSGVSFGHICDIESGKHTNLSVDTIRRLSAALQIKPLDVFKALL